MLGIYSSPASVENEVQEAIINENKSNETFTVKTMLAKRAQILNKDKYKEAIMAKKGEEVHIEWDVKNFTNQDWSEDVIITCLPSSDIYINEQHTNLALKKASKGTIGVKFLAPTATHGKDILDIHLCLFDRINNKPIGEVLKVKLVVAE